MSSMVTRDVSHVTAQLREDWLLTSVFKHTIVTRVCKPGRLFQTRVFRFGKLQTWVSGLGLPRPTDGRRYGPDSSQAHHSTVVERWSLTGELSPSCA